MLWSDIVAMAPTRADWRSDVGEVISSPAPAITATWLQPADHSPQYTASANGYLVLTETDDDGRDYMIIATSAIAMPPPATQTFLGWPYFRVFRDAVNLTVNGDPVTG